MSRRPSVAASEAQGVTASSSDASDQNSSTLSKPATDHLMSVEDLDSNERMEEEKKEAVDEKEKSEELNSTDESPAKMEVDPTNEPTDEEKSMSVTWCRIAG